jgi:hypothetical protein
MNRLLWDERIVKSTLCLVYHAKSSGSKSRNLASLQVLTIVVLQYWGVGGAYWWLPVKPTKKDRLIYGDIHILFI